MATVVVVVVVSTRGTQSPLNTNRLNTIFHQSTIFHLDFSSHFTSLLPKPPTTCLITGTLNTDSGNTSLLITGFVKKIKYMHTNPPLIGRLQLFTRYNTRFMPPRRTDWNNARAFFHAALNLTRFDTFLINLRHTLHAVINLLPLAVWRLDGCTASQDSVRNSFFLSSTVCLTLRLRLSTLFSRSPPDRHDSGSINFPATPNLPSAVRFPFAFNRAKIYKSANHSCFTTTRLFLDCKYLFATHMWFCYLARLCPPK